jgi:hypothetical protein
MQARPSFFNEWNLPKQKTNSTGSNTDEFFSKLKIMIEQYCDENRGKMPFKSEGELDEWDSRVLTKLGQKLWFGNI